MRSSSIQRRKYLFKPIRREALWGVIFAAPAILGFILFVLGPMIASLVLSFTNYSVAAEKLSFVGIKNYIRLINGSDIYFYKALFVTAAYVCVAVPLGISFYFLLANALNRPMAGRGIFRTIFFLPSIVPMVATCTIWMWLFNPHSGLLNYLLTFFYIPAQEWISSETGVLPSIILVAVWIAGNTCITLLANMQGVPRQLYEAIELDGGGSYRKMIHVTLPMVTPTIFYNSILGIIGGFQVILQPMIMTDGGPNNASLFYSLYLYREAFRYSRIGSACAMAWVLFLLIALLTALVFHSSRKWVYYEGNKDIRNTRGPKKIR